jgi:CDP-glycerol glycerophosphotransferase (TagB/SpsB family)
VAASRYRGIRLGFQSIGSALPGLIAAVEKLEGVSLIIKPHPAESPAPYAARLSEAGALRSRVVPPKSDLIELIHAADALVTVESLSAVEALVLERPVVVLSMPTNLAEMVKHGAAVGVGMGEDPSRALESLRDPATLERLRQARERYLPELASGRDGLATARIVSLLRETAESGRVVR